MNNFRMDHFVRDFSDFGDLWSPCVHFLEDRPDRDPTEGRGRSLSPEFPRNGSQARFLIIYFHSNAEDLGRCRTVDPEKELRSEPL